MKKKKACSNVQNSEKIVIFKGWLLKGQSHFLQLKNIDRKKILGKNDCVKFAGVLL
jgi:hypothetical protein